MFIDLKGRSMSRFDLFFYALSNGGLGFYVALKLAEIFQLLEKKCHFFQKVVIFSNTQISETA